jgi:hypothetical protein
VLRVIEIDIEAFVEAAREIFQRRIAAAHVSVADRAHWDRGCSELAAMAIGAGFVTGEARDCRVVGPFVARVAGEGTVTLARVKKL